MILLQGECVEAQCLMKKQKKRKKPVFVCARVYAWVCTREYVCMSMCEYVCVCLEVGVVIT